MAKLAEKPVVYFGASRARYTLLPMIPPMLPTEISNAMPTARLEEGASEFPIHETRQVKGQYRPPATGKRKPYVMPGYAGLGIASCAMKPATAIEYPAIMYGERLRVRSEAHAKISVSMAAKT